MGGTSIQRYRLFVLTFDPLLDTFKKEDLRRIELTVIRAIGDSILVVFRCNLVKSRRVFYRE